MSEQQRHSGLDPVQGRARPADADLRQAASAQPEAEHPISELFAESEPAEEGVTARRSIGRHRRRGAGHDAELRLLLSVHRAAAETDDPDHHPHPRQVAEEFGDLVRHSGEEYIHVLEGTIVVHTEFYDPVTLDAGESIYIDSNMGHAYVAAEGCDEAVALGICSSADESLMSSLMTIHDHASTSGEAESPTEVRVRRLASPGV